jgi:hypothetical protein
VSASPLGFLVPPNFAFLRTNTSNSETKSRFAYAKAATWRLSSGQSTLRRSIQRSKRVEPGMELHQERLAGLVQARTALALTGLRRVAGGITIAIQALRTATTTIIKKFDNGRDATRERSSLKRYINASNPTARRRHT